MIYSSRSAVESYHDCPRYRYNQNFLLDKGVVPKQRSIPLVTGSAVHRGVEHLLNRYRIGATPDVETAVQLAIGQYEETCETAGFSGKGVETDHQQHFTFCEQKALVEGLIRAWWLREFPKIVERYEVLAVERDIVPIEIVSGVMFQAKVDAEFKEKTTGEFHNYSLKTVGMWNERSENSYKSDLQGITEIWAVEEDHKRMLGEWQEATNKIELLASLPQYGSKNLTAIETFLKKSKPSEKEIMGVRFCFLVKGQRKKSDYGNDEDRPYVTYSPLIRGYKNITPSEVNYAHSWFYPNPNNKSGKGALGKGWEPFNVWEETTVKSWIETLNSGQIQPECGDILDQQVITPPEYFRNKQEMEEAIQELQYQESSVMVALETMKCGEGLAESELLRVFPHRRKHCYFHFGGVCEYMELCWSGEVQSDPIGSGLYQIREPHHIYEKENS